MGGICQQIHQICQLINLTPDLVTVRKSVSRNWGVNLPADLVTVRKFASRNWGGICQQIPQICQLVNLPGGKSAGIFTKSASQ